MEGDEWESSEARLRIVAGDCEAPWSTGGSSFCKEGREGFVEY